MGALRWLRFSELDEHAVPDGPGLYEIHLRSGIPLKVGVSTNLLKRLKDHRASRESGLKLKPDGSWSRPEDVVSKKSILAKHLYFDKSISPEHDLTTQDGRAAFLETCCVVLVQAMATIGEAKLRERVLEKSGEFRYVGQVRPR